jgi:hypothetical protein
MYRLYRLLFLLCLLCVAFFCFADETPETDKPKIFFQPILSYKIISFENITFHNPTGGLSVGRFNPASKNLFSVATMYGLTLTEGIQNKYPDIYHNIILSFNGKTGRHSFLGAFTANTDKPLYGGLHTFNAFAGYTYNLIQRPHFSMVLGGYLMFMDIGVALPNGTAWLFWTLPFLSLKWDYEWIDVSLLPGITITIADGKPLSFAVSKKTGDFDAAFWYHYFRNKNPSAELFGIGIGLKNATSEVKTAAGDIYGINYYALYAGIRIFKMIEVNGGWTFNGKEKYDQVHWGSIFETYGHSDEFDYQTEIGNGFFFSVSVKAVF